MSLDLALTATDRYFELTEIRAWLDARPDTFEDPWRPNRYLINGYPAVAEIALERCWLETTQRPLGCVVYLGRNEIGVIQELGTSAALRSTLAFLRWLTDEYACCVRVDDKTDLTDRVRRDGIASLYHHPERSAPVAWDDELIPVGFYADLAHGRVFGASIERACRDTAGPDDGALVAYLESGHIYRRAETIAKDVLDGELEIWPAHLLTDGVYVWPADLPYYVRCYHVALPRAFMIHARANRFAMPRDVDLASLPDVEIR